MKLTDKTINLLPFLFMGVILCSCIAVHGQVTSTNISTVKARTVKSKKPERVSLAFKVQGIKTKEDARIIDRMFENKLNISSISTEFGTGLYHVETDKIENKLKAIDVISVAGKKMVHMITAELLECNVVKKDTEVII
jgi:hypothetical protein